MPRSFTQALAALPLLLCLLAVPALGANSSVITITVPENALQTSLAAMLPFSMQPQSNHVAGDLILESIENLRIQPDGVSFQGLVSGRNLLIKTEIMGQPVELKLAALQMALKSKVLVRFVPSTRMLYLKPTFMKPPSAATNEQTEPLLALMEKIAGKEYPVNLGQLPPLATSVNGQEMHIGMDIVGVDLRNSVLGLQLTPKPRRTR